MPDLNLEPHEYADRDPNSGKWCRPLSKKAARNWFFGAVVGLVVVFLTRDTGSSAVTFGLTTMFGIAAGVFAQQWLRDLY